MIVAAPLRWRPSRRGRVHAYGYGAALPLCAAPLHPPVVVVVPAGVPYPSDAPPDACGQCREKSQRAAGTTWETTIVTVSK